MRPLGNRHLCSVIDLLIGIHQWRAGGVAQPSMAEALFSVSSTSMLGEGEDRGRSIKKKVSINS